MKYRRLNMNLITGLVLAGIVFIPVLVSLFYNIYDPNAMDGTLINKAPSLSHIFGTDNFGRDILMRVIEGAGTTFLISILTIIIGAVIGTVVGAFTGYYGGIVDEILMRLNDGLSSFPSILLALVVVSVMKTSTYNIVIALSLVFIPSFSRIMRAEFKSERERDYVKNAKLMGANDFRIIFTHILPNTLPILFSTALVGINNAILAEAGLSYLGLGVQPPNPSLGRMLAEAQPFILSAPWYVCSVALVMITAILGITLMGENIGVSGVNLRAVKRKIERRKLQERKTSNIKAYAGTDNIANNTDIVNKTEDSQNSDNTSNILTVENMTIGFIEDTGIENVVNNISFSLKKGEILGIVGESGSGKSITSLAVIGILPERAAITGGKIYYNGTELTGLKEKEYSKLRGKKLAMVFQEPMTSLNPSQTVGRQIDEVLDIHMPDEDENSQKKRVLKALKCTGLSNNQQLYNMYPHQLSGGMRQRVMIAMALVAEAEVIIADEPTTALDADTQTVILELLKRINTRYGTSIIFISHDLRVIESICDRTLIMRKGLIEETLKISDKKGWSEGHFEVPHTIYGKGLLRAAFNSERLNKKYYSAEEYNNKKPLIQLKNLNVFYMNRGKGIFKRAVRKQVNFDVSLDIYRGEIIGIVGESGCGKSTLIKAVAGLQKYYEGEVIINCDKPGMVFQDPYGSLNPAKKVGWLLAEPLRIKGGYDKNEIERRVKMMLENIELDDSYADRRISELSGGERQRVAIALTIMHKQDLILLDEPVSALDVTIQEQILELLVKLKKKYDLTYIFISHDMKLINRMCDRILLMKDGRITGEQIITK